MVCGSCGAANRDSRKFCGECGAPLTGRCVACGAVSDPGTRFCGECGTALLAAGTAPAPGTATAEMRRVSVVFCDLVGYTAIAEMREAEDVRELLSGYFDVARTVVTRYGGVVEKFIGDAVMAVWGTPATHEDDAERAVRAALELVDAVARYGEEVRVPLQARAGVVTGRAASIANPLEGLVVGDRVNTAARAQAVAQPGSVLVDEGTREVTSSAVRYRDAGRHLVKGKTDPLQLWQAERVVAGVRGELRLDGLEAPLVGRARELAVVKELFHACLEDRRARLVALSGEPGTGKSRLLWEFEKYVDGLAGEVLWHSGRCVAYGEGVAFWALAEMVRQRLGIAQDDPRDVARERLDAGIERWVVDAELRPFLAPALGVLLGCEDAELSPQELIGGWRLFVEQLAEESPVVLAFEDMQWADPGLLDFLEQLLDWSATRPLFVLVLSRPELFDRRPTLVGGRRNAGSVRLERLPDGAVDTLLSGLVPDLPPAARRLIVDQAEGVPLYAVESVRSLLDRGLLTARDGVYSLVGEVDELEVPPTLAALLAARLDLLAPAERALVRDLCVLRGRFPRAAVDAMTDVPGEAVETALTGLVRKDVLGIGRDPLSPERGQYSFVQSLLRGVAYDTLAKRERKARHLRAAEYLRRAYPDDGEEVAEVVAAHYRDAWAAAPDGVDAEAIRRLAAEAFERAGDRAAALGAPLSAEQAYRSAAGLAAEEASSARLLAAAARMIDRAGRLEEALELYDRLTAQYRAAGRDREARELAAPSSHLLIRLGRLTEAEARLRAALRDVAPGDPTAAQLMLGLARVAVYEGGDPEVMLAASDRALSVGAARGDPTLLADAALQRAHALHRASRASETLAMLRWATDLLGDEGPYELRVRVLGNHGMTLVLHDLPGAEQSLDATLEAARRAGDAPIVIVTDTALAGLDVLRGRWDQAEQRLAGYREDLGAIPEAEMRLGQLVELHCLRGRTAEAREYLERLSHWSGHDDRWIASAHHMLAAMLAQSTGDDEAALQHGAEAVRATASFGLFEEILRNTWPITVDAALRLGRTEEAASLLAIVADAPPGFVPPFLHAQLARLRGRLTAESGGSTGVEEDLRAAVDELARLDYPYWRALAQADLADWLDGQGRAADATPARAEAVTVLTELSAQPALRRVQRPTAVPESRALSTT